MLDMLILPMIIIGLPLSFYLLVWAVFNFTNMVEELIK